MGFFKSVMMFRDDLESDYSEFEAVVYKILYYSDEFRNPSITNGAKDVGYDISAEEIAENKKLLQANFILKSGRITKDYVSKIISIWEKSIGKGLRVYLVTTDEISDSIKKLVKSSGLHIWSIYELYHLSEKADKKARNAQEKTKEKIIAVPRTEEEKLEIALNKIEAGKDEWDEYQELCFEIFNHLFSPPLISPKYEHEDADGRNRRDMIFENSVQNFFWSSIRDIYSGHYIVVDAKNSTQELSKAPVIGIAHYLKPYGCGMFGIIMTRIGEGEACRHAIKEQWIANNKMIVVISDKDVIEMLRVKQNGGAPEEVIRMKISNFRLSL